MIANITRTIEEMKEEAELKGRLKAQLEVGEKMLRLGMDIGDITRITELTLEEVEKLKIK